MFASNREKAIKICQAALDWLLLALVFLIPLYFAFFHETYNVFTLEKAVILRVFVSIAALVYLAKIFLAGRIEYRFGRYFFVLLILLAGSWLLSASFSRIPAFAFWGNYERQQGFFTLIFFLLFLWLLLLELKDLFQAKRLVLAMLISSFFACGYGLIQFFGLDLIKWAETSRIFSTFGQPDFFGHWLILVIPFSVYVLIFWVRRFPVRLVVFLLLLGQLFCLLFTYSRSAWLGLAAEIFFFLLLFLFFQGRKKIALGLLIFSVAVAISASLFFSFSPRPAPANYSLQSRLETAFDFSQGSVKARLNIWQGALAIFRQESLFRQLFGWGPDSLYEPFAGQYQGSWSLDEKINSWPDRAHDLFLDIVLSFGLVGLAVYGLLFLYLLKSAWNFLKIAPRDDKFWLAVACLAALIGYFVNNLFNFSDIPEYLYFYLILGLLVFSLAPNRAEQEIKISLSVFSRTAIFISFFLLVAIFIFYFNLEPLAADHYFIKTVAEVNYNCPEALDDNLKAIAWGGGNSLYYQGEYLVSGLLCFERLSAENKEKLRDNLLFYSATLPAEKYFSFAESKAEVEAMLDNSGDGSDYPQAERDFSALAEKYPQTSVVYEDWANFELARGESDAVLKIVGAGLKTLPLADMASRGYFSHRPEIEAQLINYDSLLGAAYEQKKEGDMALQDYEKIIGMSSRYPDIYKKIADIYYQKKDWDKALWYNEEGYRLNPSDPAWSLAIGLLKREKGDLSGAIASFKEVLKLDPANAEAEKNLNELERPVK